MRSLRGTFAYRTPPNAKENSPDSCRKRKGVAEIRCPSQQKAERRSNSSASGRRTCPTRIRPARSGLADGLREGPVAGLLSDVGDWPKRGVVRYSVGILRGDWRTNEAGSRQSGASPGAHSERRQERNGLPSVTAVNAEMAVGGEDLAAGRQFGHPHQAGIGQAHGKIGVLAHQVSQVRPVFLG